MAILMWLYDLENSKNPEMLSKELYECIKKDLINSFSNDTKQIIEEFDFYWKLTPKMQGELINHIFKDFLASISGVFDGCDSQFMNNFIIRLNYNMF